LNAVAEIGLPVGIASITSKEETREVPSRDEMKRYGWLPCHITVEIAAVGLRVSDLLNLQPGAIVATAVQQGIDLPLRCNGEVIGYGEFEVIGNKLAVRIRELI
jgi:flagellar motor switch/type III secretory pathway protein FliN